MGKVEVKLQVDSEVKALGEAIIELCSDIKAKKAVGEDVSHLMAKLLPELGNMAALPDHVKESSDNRKFLAMSLEQVVEVFVLPSQPAAPAAA